jgi:Mrp family chromosome partitioning ATPase
MAEMAEFKKEHEFIEVRSDGMGTLRGLENAEERLRESRLAYESLLVEYENLRREINKIPDHIVKAAYEDDPIKDRISHTEIALLHARARYADDNPKIKVLEEELTQLRSMITEGVFEDAAEKVYVRNDLKEGLNIELVRLQGKLRSSQKRKEEAELVLMQMQQELSTLPEEQMSFVRMLHKKGMLEEQLQMAEEAIRSAEMLISLGRGDVEIYQLAETAAQSESKILKYLPLAGLGLGLALGLVLALVLEATNRRLCTGKEIGISYTAPCLQVIPEIGRLNAKTAEAKTLFFIRSLSDRLSYVTGRGQLASVAVTSGVAGEGKSTVAWNLAKYQKKLGKEVCYLQLDHQSTLYTDVSASGYTLNDFLRGQASLDQVLRQGDVDWAATEWAEDLKELLGGPNGDKLFQGLRQRYDLIVIDAPGVIDDDYAVTVCPRADALLFVVGSSKVKRPLVDTALTELEENGIQPTGIVLNRVRSTYCNDPRLAAERKRQRRSWLRSWTLGKAKAKGGLGDNA